MHGRPGLEPRQRLTAVIDDHVSLRWVPEPTRNLRAWDYNCTDASTRIRIPRPSLPGGGSYAPSGSGSQTGKHPRP